MELGMCGSDLPREIQEEKIHTRYRYVTPAR